MSEPEPPPDDDATAAFEELERRALFDLPEDEPEAIDVLASLRGTAGEAPALHDLTLGGYIERHDRVPAFEGSDGQPYTVDLDTEAPAAAGQPYTGFLIFIRWAATGAGIMDHVESTDLTRGATEEEARDALLALSLYEIKSELDAAIERRRALEE